MENETRRVLGGLGSNVYPTVAEGAFGMTNEIVSAVFNLIKVAKSGYSIFCGMATPQVLLEK
jgi:hypothetical protein